MIAIKEALVKMVYANALKDLWDNIVKKNCVLIIVMEMVCAIMDNVSAKSDLQVNEIKHIVLYNYHKFYI
jgi:hypothetical protein